MFGLDCNGGDGEDRTLDLHTASVALSQLSYAPKSSDDNDYQQDDYIPFFTVCQHKKAKFLYDAEQASAVFSRDTFDILDRHSLDLCNLLGHSVNIE